MSYRTRTATLALVLPALLLAGCGEDTLSSADLEEEVSDQLEALVGERPASVDCPDMPAEEGAEERCTLTADDGSRIGLTVTVTELTDGDASISIVVDDEVEAP